MGLHHPFLAADGILSGSFRLAVRLTPKGGRDAIDGWMRDSAGEISLKVRVRAVPEDGKANEALITLIAKTLHVAKSDVQLIAGATSRHKRLGIEGDPVALTARLQSLFGTAPK